MAPTFLLFSCHFYFSVDTINLWTNIVLLRAPSQGMKAAPPVEEAQCPQAMEVHRPLEVVRQINDNYLNGIGEELYIIGLKENKVNNN